MNPLMFLRGETLGKTIYNYVAAVVLLIVIIWVGWGLATGKYWKWKADRLETRAENAEAVAATATVNAENANGSAANATATRAGMDGQTIEIRVRTEDAARRIETHVPTDVDADGAVPADILRELESAHDRAGAAADRLQRTRPR